MRKSGEPYLVHPLNVAFLLADWNLDEETVVTGLLHDTVEDTMTTLEEVRDLFGESVAHLVDGVTKIGRVTLSDAAAQKAESLRKMILAMGKDLRVILVKLADRLHNMRTLKHLPSDRQTMIARETSIYEPIAAGSDARIRTELESCFEVIHREHTGARAHADERKRTAKQTLRTYSLLESKCREGGIDATITGRSTHGGDLQKRNSQETFAHTTTSRRRMTTKRARRYKPRDRAQPLEAGRPIQAYIAMPKAKSRQGECDRYSLWPRNGEGAVLRHFWQPPEPSRARRDLLGDALSTPDQDPKPSAA